MKKLNSMVMQYRDYLLGVVSDIEFPRGGELSAEAGFELARLIRDAVPDVPIVLQSSRTQFRDRAHAEKLSFLRKRSPTLMADLRQVLMEEFGFGDFVFRLPDLSEVGRATDLSSLETMLQEVPAESVAYHAQRNHFSHWLMARTEFALAQKLRPRKVSDFASTEHLRNDLIASIADYRSEQSEVLIADFSPAALAATDSFFLRIGVGSLGGKARGLAFMRHLLRRQRFSRIFPDVRVSVPPAVVLATDVFDRFLSENDLADFAMNCADDAEIERRFLEASFPASVRNSLLEFLSEVRYPLAVRSSSLLEDSQYQPFTGVYETFMLANHASGSFGAARLPAGGDQAGLRFHLQPARQGVCAGHALPPGRREDGGHPAAGGGSAAWHAFLSGFLRRGALLQLLSRAADEFSRRNRGRGLGLWGARWSMAGSV